MITRILKRDQYYNSISENDPIEKQQYVLFVMFSIVAILMSFLIFFQATIIYHLARGRFMPYTLLVFAIILVANYFAFQKHRNTKVAYSVIIIFSSFILHFFCYFTGGVYAPANFYLAVFEITAFMLLGSTVGWAYLGFAFGHMVWMYYATAHTGLISDYHGADITGKYLSLVVNAFIALTSITLLCASIAKSTKLIIKAMHQSQENMQRSMVILEKTNDELDRFAYIVSHDLKAPLRAIDSLSQWIEEDSIGKLNEETVENLHLLRSRVKRMDSLITAILEYSKVNRLRSDNEFIDVEEIIQEALLLVVPPPNFTLHILSQPLPTIQTDLVKMEQVFANLIGNAIKFNDKEKINVDIDCQETPNEWKFSVTDNGPGISPQYHDKIFNAFQTIQSRDVKDSAGLGLAIVKKIIEEQGGAISVESKLGMGARFVFTIPKAPTIVMVGHGPNEFRYSVA